MAMADYRLCDLCGNKAFYDSNLNYDFSNCHPVTGEPKLDRVGDMAVLCDECAKTHEVLIRVKDATTSAKPSQPHDAE